MVSVLVAPVTLQSSCVLASMMTATVAMDSVLVDPVALHSSCVLASMELL